MTFWLGKNLKILGVSSITGFCTWISHLKELDDRSSESIFGTKILAVVATGDMRCPPTCSIAYNHLGNLKSQSFSH